MPHGHDIDEDPATPSTYECLQCGALVETNAHPGPCSCGGAFQNRSKSLE